MTSKRQADRENGAGRRVKRQRSRSVPAMNNADNEDLSHLFSGSRPVESENENLPPEDVFDDMNNYANEVYGDENDDPMLDSVPVNMDPEQLGFLVCAQETLRFLHGRGIPIEHPLFSRLRLRLLRGINELAMA